MKNILRKLVIASGYKPNLAEPTNQKVLDRKWGNKPRKWKQVSLTSWSDDKSQKIGRDEAVSWSIEELSDTSVSMNEPCSVSRLLLKHM
jgi:hypothetical protein